MRSRFLTQPDQLSVFDAALVAFEIRFERELTSRWQKLEHEAIQRILSNPSGREKHVLLGKFFDNAKEELANTVHEISQSCCS